MPEPSTKTLKRSASSFLSNSLSSRDATRTFSASAFVAATARCAVVRLSAPTESFWRALRRRVGASASLSAAAVMQSAKESCMVQMDGKSCAAPVSRSRTVFPSTDVLTAVNGLLWQSCQSGEAELAVRY